MIRSRGLIDGISPTAIEVREARGDLTQAQAGAMVYTSDRVWRRYESGDSRMHPAMWELFLMKLDLSDNVQ